SQKKKRIIKGMAIEKSTIELGEITRGEKLLKELAFLNNSKKDLKISSVETSDTLMLVNYEINPIPASENSTISVSIPTNKPGRFSKTVVINSNSKNSPVRVTYTGIVSEKPSTSEVKIGRKVENFGEEENINKGKNNASKFKREKTENPLSEKNKAKLANRKILRKTAVSKGEKVDPPNKKTSKKTAVSEGKKTKKIE
ncbi:DUF1573 domain-containing protein, partial [Bacteroidota bacterium]